MIHIKIFVENFTLSRMHLLVTTHVTSVYHTKVLKKKFNMDYVNNSKPISILLGSIMTKLQFVHLQFRNFLILYPKILNFRFV